MSIITSKYVAESGHFYKKDGSPAYTIIGKNGKERATTLRDARKEGLLPSVTTITRESAKPGLENWKQDQVLLSALTLPRIPDEPEQDYISRIKEDAKQQAIMSAERGTQIHAYVQRGFEGLLDKEEIDGRIYYETALKEVEKECGKQKWICEWPFATDMYGGKIDLTCPDFLLDIKTKETIDDNIRTWDEHDMQIGAYRQGINHKGQGGILFVSTKDLTAKIVWIPTEKLLRGINMFNALLEYWYSKTGL